MFFLQDISAVAEFALNLPAFGNEDGDEQHGTSNGNKKKLHRKYAVMCNIRGKRAATMPALTMDTSASKEIAVDTPIGRSVVAARIKMGRGAYRIADEYSVCGKKNVK